MMHARACEGGRDRTRHRALWNQMRSGQLNKGFSDNRTFEILFKILFTTHLRCADPTPTLMWKGKSVRECKCVCGLSSA